MDKYKLYEEFKKELKRVILSPQQYEAIIKILAQLLEI